MRSAANSEQGILLPIPGDARRAAPNSGLRRHGNSLEILSRPKCGGG